MTVAELINELAKYPAEMPVCIVDWQANINAADESGDDSSVGVYEEVEIDFFEETEDNPSPFVAILFDTDPPSILMVNKKEEDNEGI